MTTAHNSFVFGFRYIFQSTKKQSVFGPENTKQETTTQNRDRESFEIAHTK